MTMATKGKYTDNDSATIIMNNNANCIYDYSNSTRGWKILFVCTMYILKILSANSANIQSLAIANMCASSQNQISIEV